MEAKAINLITIRKKMPSQACLRRLVKHKLKKTGRVWKESVTGCIAKHRCCYKVSVEETVL